MIGLMRYWGNGLESSGVGTAEFSKVVEGGRKIWADAAQRQLDIAKRAHSRIVKNIANFAAACLPQEVAKQQAEMTALMAETSAQHSVVWAQCCRSIGDECATFLGTDKAESHAWEKGTKVDA